MAESVAFVGAAGGTGTTRITLACAELLAREGHDAVILDAAYGTQGLADRTSGAIDPDITQLCLEEIPLESGLLDRSIQGGGRLSVCPARAPFSRVAKAKTVEAAERFEARIEEATRQFEYVLIDTPPVAANQAVAAVTGGESVAVVCDAPRAEAAIPRAIDRLKDIGIEEWTTVVTRASTHPDADVTVPTLKAEPPVVDETTAAYDALCAVVDETTGVDIGRETAEGLLSKLSFR